MKPEKVGYFFLGEVGPMQGSLILLMLSGWLAILALYDKTKWRNFIYAKLFMGNKIGISRYK